MWTLMVAATIHSQWCSLGVRAGDGNRTRVLSLGIRLSRTCVNASDAFRLISLTSDRVRTVANSDDRGISAGWTPSATGTAHARSDGIRRDGRRDDPGQGWMDATATRFAWPASVVRSWTSTVAMTARTEFSADMAVDTRPRPLKGVDASDNNAGCCEVTRSGFGLGGKQTLRYCILSSTRMSQRGLGPIRARGAR
jgi:hypothetical protein